MREDKKILVNTLFAAFTSKWKHVCNADGSVNPSELMCLLLENITEKPTLPIETNKQRQNGRMCYDEKVQLAARFITALSKTGGWPGRDSKLAEQQLLEKMKKILKNHGSN